ncbi:RNA exonuclease Ngl2p [Monosporozyma unispora]|nr:RNA exonuclease ngl2 [Kazachstania unispora]
MTCDTLEGVKSVIPKEGAETANMKKISTTEVKDKKKPIKAKNKQSKKGRKGKPSPEEIARIRAERQAKKEEMIKNGVDPTIPPELNFIKREMLYLHDKESDPVKGFNFTLMTYNCLAQALIRRKLFPASGEAVKWLRRSKVLLNKFKHYNSDVICLQEVDVIQYQSFWKEELEKLGYESQFYKKGSKNHGISIAWKRDLFEMTDKMLIDYDKEPSGDIPTRTTTNNVGLVLALKFSKKVLKQFPNTNRSGILIGTTHLFWHPFGTYDRTRQTYVVLNKMKEFIHRVNVLQEGNDSDDSHWYPFFCGDFNSQPYDTPYLSMTKKPITYEDRAKTVIGCSTSFKFSKKRDGESDLDDEEGGNIEKFGKDQPQSPVPKSFTPTEEQATMVQKIESLHNALNMRAISLYSVGYGEVHPENAGLDNSRGEPEISNWAHTWNGLLDYLFYIKKWDFDDKRQVDSLDVFENENGVKIRGFLRMPAKEEMEKLGHGQPHTGEYPSDHLTMVCDLELNM